MEKMAHSTNSISEPIFYGDLVYKFKRIVGKPNFSDQLKKLVKRYILKPTANWSLFKLIISDQTPIKFKWFLPIYVHFNGQTFSSVLNSFLLLQCFLG